MELFRRKQKWIFWIVTIIIVPSFVFFWGVDNPGSGGQQGDIATVNGNAWSWHECQEFQKRIAAAVGEQLRFVVAGAPDNETTGGIWTYIWAYSLLLDAEKAGIRVADKQVGTFIRKQHPVFSNVAPEAIDAEVDKYCQRMGISRDDFLRGVRELLTITNYVTSDSAAVAVTDDSAYALYAQRGAQLLFKRFRSLETPATSEQAKKDILDLPPAELETRIRDHAGRVAATDARYREPARWKFAYVFIPNVSDIVLRSYNEEEVRKFYQDNRAALYGNRTLDQVRGEIFVDMAVRESERMTMRNLTMDVDPQLRDHPELTLEELGKLTPLVKNSVRTGVTDDGLLTSDEIAATSLFGGEPTTKRLLDMIDGIGAEQRDPQIEQWKNGFDLNMRPIKVPQGYLRLRLLDYQPSTEAATDNPDGTLRTEIRDMAVADLVGERVTELTLENAEETMEKLRVYYDALATGEKPEDDFAESVDAVPEETILYSQVDAPDDGMLTMLGIGDLQPPRPFSDIGTGAKGWEIRIVTGRRIPSRAAFDAEPPEVRNGIRFELLNNIQGQVGIGFAGHEFVYQVKPTGAMWADFVERMRKSEIALASREN